MMNQCSRYIFAVFFLVIIPGWTQSAAQQNTIHIDSVEIVHDELAISFHLEELFSRNILESMDKGIGISILYQVTLWKKRGTWFDKSETLQEILFRVKYNKFNQRYIWISQDERRATPSLEKVESLCSIHKDVPIIDAAEIEEDDEYYITIKCIINPHSIEDFEDVRDWLSGEFDEVDLKELRRPKQSQEKVSGRLFSVFKNLTGFGDRIYNGTSRIFTCTGDGSVNYTQKIILRKEN